jgi:hypothetical protein
MPSSIHFYTSSLICGFVSLDQRLERYHNSAAKRKYGPADTNHKLPFGLYKHVFMHFRNSVIPNQCGKIISIFMDIEQLPF